MARQGGKIIFIGAPGSGKTTFGALYAAEHGQKVFDTDSEFTRRYGDISAYFEAYGERAFRDIECETVRCGIESDAKVISCGGGVVLDKGNMNALRRAGTIVRLTAGIDELKKRVEFSDRPLKNKMTDIVALREQLYSRYADCTVDTTGDENTVLNRIENALSVPRKNRYDVLLCDSDDTLLDFKRGMRGAVVAAARAVGVTKSDDEILKVYTEIVPYVWGKLERGEIDGEQLDLLRFSLFRDRIGENIDDRAMNEIYIAEMQKTRYVIDGAVEFLKKVRARGVKTYIITNSFARIADERLKALDGLTDGKFISEYIGYNKPDPRFFARVLSEIGSPDPHRTLVFGDSLTSDIAGGISSGLDTCLFDLHHEHTGNRIGDYTVNSYDEVLDII